MYFWLILTNGLSSNGIIWLENAYKEAVIESIYTLRLDLPFVKYV